LSDFRVEGTRTNEFQLLTQNAMETGFQKPGFENETATLVFEM